MARIVVVGAGLTGTAAALLLARDGHRVTVLERDAAAPSGDAAALWESWRRPGVSQFRLGHLMLGRWRGLVGRELPDVLAEVERLGGRSESVVDALPDSVTGGPRAGDDELRSVFARRPVLEAALAVACSRTRGLVVRRGVRAVALLRGGAASHGVPHVAGVVSDGDEPVPADLVVDAMGRHSPLPKLLAAIGARRPAEEREPLGFVYYARHFRVVGDDVPPMAAALIHVEGMSLLRIPADNGTFSVLFSCAANDRELRALRDEAAWERVRALFGHLAMAHVPAEPITPVQVMPGGADRHLAFVHDGEPVATGVVAVGDAAMRTNPSLGRGASIGLLQARVLRDVLRAVGTEPPERLVTSAAAAFEAEVMPLYRRTVAEDRARMAEIQADIVGAPHPPRAPDWALTRALAAVAPKDRDVLRAYARTVAQILDPRTAVEDPAVRARLRELAPTPPGYPRRAPTRAQVLAAIDADR